MRTRRKAIIAAIALGLLGAAAAGALLCRHRMAPPLDPRNIAGCYVFGFAEAQTPPYITEPLFALAPESLVLDTNVAPKHFLVDRDSEAYRRLAPLHPHADSLRTATLRWDSLSPIRYWLINPHGWVELHVSWLLRGTSLYLRPSNDDLVGTAVLWNDMCDPRPPDGFRQDPGEGWSASCAPTFSVQLTRIACRC